MEEGQKQYLKLSGGTLTGNVTCDSGVTIDGTDISAHVADVDAHHLGIRSDHVYAVRGRSGRIEARCEARHRGERRRC